MERNSKIRVLVVDDSLVFRSLISQTLNKHPLIEVIATAVDPFDAIDKIVVFKPDVMTCDIEMPKMNGIEFIDRLLPQYAIPIVVVSTISEATFDALKVGAVDFVVKDSIRTLSDRQKFMDELTDKVLIAASANLSHREINNATKYIQPPRSSGNASKEVIAIGASTGGTEAIFSILSKLPQTIPGIIVVQHIPPVFSRMFAERIDRQTHFSAKEARTGDWVKPGTVLIAPGDKHLKVVRVGKALKVICSEGENVSGHCPSVDVMFDSVAKEVGDKAIGIILTGMGTDGAKGLLRMRACGARTIGQDEATSVVYGMPKEAYMLGAVERKVSLGSIPQIITSML